MRALIRKLAYASLQALLLLSELPTTSLFTSSLLSYFTSTEPHTAFTLFTRTKSLFPTKQHVFVQDRSFELSQFLQSQGHPLEVCLGEPGGFKKLAYRDEGGMDPDFFFGGSGTSPPRQSGLTEVLMDGVFDFFHKGVAFQVFHASWSGPHGPEQSFHFVFDGPDDRAGKALVTEVYEFQRALKDDEVWVFSQGRWGMDRKLYKTIQAADWDDLILDAGMVQQLKLDTVTFFEAKDIYKSLNVPWKRGIILLGPPENGKTQTMQVLLKDAIDAGIGALYVKSLKSLFGGMGAEMSIREIFQLARKSAPCILVLEDLDAMIQDDIRSFFLNELDGLENNDGILTIATTNHPEKIDDAILKRPSRFDRIYNFDLPTLALRERYAGKWIEKLAVLGGVQVGTKETAALVEMIANRTEEWSFAFLKELFISFLLQTAGDQSTGADTEYPSAAEMLGRQIDLLGEQVARGEKAMGGEDDRAGTGRRGSFQQFSNMVVGAL